MQSTVADDAKVGRRGNGDPIREKRAILSAVAIKPRGVKFCEDHFSILGC